MSKQATTFIVSGLLLLALIGLFVVYLGVVDDLPSRIYTVAQQEFLNYNYQRNVAQVAPTWNFSLSDGAAYYNIAPDRIEASDAVGEIYPLDLPVRKSRIQADLTARYEDREGVSVTVYDLDFRGEYHLVHSGANPIPTTVALFFPFPSELENFHEVRFVVDGEEPSTAQYSAQGIRWQTVLGAGEERRLVVSYRADGARGFAYGLYHGLRSDVDVTVRVKNLVGSEVPGTSLPATASEVGDGDEFFTWDYEDLITERDIQLNLPARLSFTQRVAQLQDEFRSLARLAPFLIGLCLASLAGLLSLGGVRLQPVIYLLTGCGLAFFYPTLTFLSGVMGLTLAALLAFGLISALLLIFLSFTAGWRRVVGRAGLLLFIFLGVLSLGMLTHLRGLLLTSGGLLLVGSFMMFYARRPKLEQASCPPHAEAIQEPELVEPSVETAHAHTDVHCPFCGRALMEAYDYCPGCGQKTDHLSRCTRCGQQQFVPTDYGPVYCIHCGLSIG